MYNYPDERYGNDPYDFTADVMPVNQQEDEEVYLTEQQKAIAWSDYEMQMLNDKHNRFSWKNS